MNRESLDGVDDVDSKKVNIYIYVFYSHHLWFGIEICFVQARDGIYLEDYYNKCVYNKIIF